MSASKGERAAALRSGRSLDLTLYSAQELAELIRSREISAVEAVRASLDKIGRDNARCNAFITIAEEDALAAAKRADQQLRRGGPSGPLHGVPIGIKDLVATKGIRTTSGSIIFRDNVPHVDDLVVARLRAAGAIVVGKTNTPEFGFGATTHNALCGPTTNPYDRTLTSGGSSGGSAVAVACGMVPVAHGTDFGGSVRTPASFCGIVGYRPTPGLVPSVAKKLSWDTIAVHGALARSVADAAIVIRVMSGGDLRDPVSASRPAMPLPDFASSDLQQSRVAASADLGVARIARAVRQVFAKGVSRMRRRLPHVVEDHPDCSGAQGAFEVIRAAMLFDSLGSYLESGFGQLSPTVQWNVDRGRHVTAKELLQAEAVRGQIYRKFLAFFERYDFLATVSASVLPFKNEQANVTEIDGVPLRNIIDYLTITYVISLVGFPAISVPCGWSAAGLPVGMQIIAKPFDDSRLFAFAYLLEQSLGFRHRWPVSSGSASDENRV